MEYELYHHGVKGMKWGVRRYQNEDGSLTDAGKRRADRTASRINKMYNRSNMWTNKKIDRLNKRGRSSKVSVMQEMIRRNEQARQKHVGDILSANGKEYKKMRSEDRKDYFFGGQMWMQRNASHMSTPLTRLSEYNMQRGIRWVSNFTLDSTLDRMTPSEGYEYLDRKNIVRITTPTDA